MDFQNKSTNTTEQNNIFSSDDKRTNTISRQILYSIVDNIEAVFTCYVNLEGKFLIILLLRKL